MVKRDPDQLLSTLSKHLKNQEKGNIRLTLKRGGLWKKQFTKAHSRKAKNVVKRMLKDQSNENTTYPLLVRLRKGETKLNTEIKLTKGSKFVQSLLGVFRVNFFQKKAEQDGKVKKQATKKDPNSKASKKKLQKKKQNLQRRKKRLQIKRKLKRQKPSIKK